MFFYASVKGRAVSARELAMAFGGSFRHLDFACLSRTSYLTRQQLLHRTQAAPSTASGFCTRECNLDSTKHQLGALSGRRVMEVVRFFSVSTCFCNK